MDSLPFEILSRIIYFLKGPYGNDKLSPYAGISISWQSAIESQTFRAMRVKLPDKSLDQLREILLTNDTRRVGGRVGFLGGFGGWVGWEHVVEEDEHRKRIYFLEDY